MEEENFRGINKLSMIKDEFRRSTDRKSLKMQLKTQIDRAKMYTKEHLNCRREMMSQLLNCEERSYEQELEHRHRTRVDIEVAARTETLKKHWEKLAVEKEELVAAKKHQQEMEGCYEVRQAMRYRMEQDTKKVVEAQIMEKERSIRHDCELDHYWYRLEKTFQKDDDQRQRKEDDFRRTALKARNSVLETQVQELNAKRKMECLVKKQEAVDLQKIMEEVRREEFDALHAPLPEGKQEYREELLKMIRERKCREKNERDEEAKLHREMCDRLDEEELQEAAAIRAKKRTFHKANMEYLAYLKRMRHFMDERFETQYQRIDDLHYMDRCTKSNITREIQRKAEAAAVVYAQLKQQMCEEVLRRLREEAEYRENKMLENCFARLEPTREDNMKARLQYRSELDKQIEALYCVRLAEEQQYKVEQSRARLDPDYCDQLAAAYLKEGNDYLEPHRFWPKLACPRPKQAEEAECSRPKRPPHVEKAGCICHPISCGDRWKLEIPYHAYRCFR